MEFLTRIHWSRAVFFFKVITSFREKVPFMEQYWIFANRIFLLSRFFSKLVLDLVPYVPFSISIDLVEHTIKEERKVRTDRRSRISKAIEEVDPMTQCLLEWAASFSSVIKSSPSSSSSADLFRNYRNDLIELGSVKTSGPPLHVSQYCLPHIIHIYFWRSKQNKLHFLSSTPWFPLVLSVVRGNPLATGHEIKLEKVGHGVHLALHDPDTMTRPASL